MAPPRLEVAMGLETAHPVALERLHKRITLERFAHAAAELRRRDVALRVFLLISPPFIPADEQDAWLLRSIDFAFDCGASVVSLVPTRSGNGAMEALRDEGQFRMPTLDDIERSFPLRSRTFGPPAMAGACSSISGSFNDLRIPKRAKRISQRDGSVSA